MELDKVVITGGLGFIFSHVTEYLVKRGYEVHVIDNLSEGSHPELLEQLTKQNNKYYTACANPSDVKLQEELYRDGFGDIIKAPTAFTKKDNPYGLFKFYKEDVSKKEVIDTILNIEPDYIIHAAAYSDVDGSIREPRDVIKANCDATLNVFEAARQLPNLKKLVYISTDEVYGECDHLKTEDEILFPKNPYSFSKAYGSLLRIAYDNTYPELKNKTAETRFCNVFGPRQDERKIMPLIKRAIKDGTPVPLHNGGGGYREYIYVLNIPPIVEEIMRHGNRTYNVTLNDGFTVKELIAEVEHITGKKVPTVPAERAGMDMKYQMNATRVLELGCDYEWDFDFGIKDYLFHD